MGLLILYVITGAILVVWEKRNFASKGLSILIPLRFAVLFHAIYLASEWLGMGPLTSPHILQAMALSLGLMYLISLRRRNSQGMLLVIFPLLLVILVGSQMVPEGGVLRDEVALHARSIFLHIMLALLGYASFFMVTLCSFLYILQSRVLKVNSHPLWLSRIPSLLELTEIKWRALTFGLVFFSLAIGLGKLSPYLWDVPHHWGAKEILSVMTWSLYLVLFCAKKYFRQRKEVFAYVSLVGCVLLLLTLLVLNLSPFSMGEIGI